MGPGPACYRDACVMSDQFLTLIPVALGLLGWLLPTRSVRLATSAVPPVATTASARSHRR